LTTEPLAPAERRGSYDADGVVAVAVAVFNERGYDGTSMEDLSRAAGITKSSIYHHVAGKEDLLRRALEHALAGLSAVTEEPAALEGPAIERLGYVIRRVVEVLLDRLPYVTLLLRVRGNTPTERWAMDQRRAFDLFVRGLVQEAANDGDVRADIEPALVERLVLGMINSVSEWYRPGPVAPDGLADSVVRLAMSGLLSGAGPARG
jgi:AcrR family transcriptional regulator